MSEKLTRRDRAALVGIADGTLEGRARRRAEARLRAIPDAGDLIGRQRRVARALGAGVEPLPRAAPAVRWRPVLRLVPAAAIAAALALLLLVLPGGEPTVERAAAISELEATGPAPAADGPVLAADVDGVEFPAWGREFGWMATGMREDDVGGRPATTVFYEHMGHRLAYTIVSGPALPRPENARIVERDGLRMSVFRDPAHGGHDVAVFERDGRTCVVAGHVMRLSTLYELAAWKGDGGIRS